MIGCRFISLALDSISLEIVKVYDFLRLISTTPSSLPSMDAWLSERIFPDLDETFAMSFSLISCVMTSELSISRTVANDDSR